MPLHVGRRALVGFALAAAIALAPVRSASAAPDEDGYRSYADTLQATIDALTVPAEPPPPPPAPAPAAPSRFAVADGLELVSPSPDLLLAGFHESSGAGRALAPHAESAHAVMPSRGRGGEPTSAVDLALPVGAPVSAPVSGTVVAAAEYDLYGSTRDVLVEIVPDARPDLKVRLLHLEAATVAPGDRVEAGVTTVATASRVLPFPSQIDRFTGAPGPHVHLEVTSA